MEKLIRNSEKFDVLELFSSMATEHGYDINDVNSINDFIKRVKSSIGKSTNNDIAVFGKRTESLFAYICAALDEVELIKQEDTGDMFCATDILAADYRLTLKNKKQYLVEIKNCHHSDPQKEFSLSKTYYKKLSNYASLNNIDLKIAIYYSAWNQWVLLSIGVFKQTKNSYKTDFIHAITKSEMALLGDYTIGTAPNLEIHLLTSPEEAFQVEDDGNTKIIIRKITIYCNGNEVHDEKEKEIAFYFMRYGEWEEQENEAILENNKFTGIKYIYSPIEKTEPNFSIIGRLSSMISSAFREHTVTNGKVSKMKPEVEPSHFKVFIPSNYEGKDLPLWRFIMHPKEKIEEELNKLRIKS